MHTPTNPLSRSIGQFKLYLAQNFMTYQVVTSASSPSCSAVQRSSTLLKMLCSKAFKCKIAIAFSPPCCLSTVNLHFHSSKHKCTSSMFKSVHAHTSLTTINSTNRASSTAVMAISHFSYVLHSTTASDEDTTYHLASFLFSQSKVPT